MRYLMLSNADLGSSSFACITNKYSTSTRIQKFHLKTMVKANQHTETSPVAKQEGSRATTDAARLRTEYNGLVEGLALRRDLSVLPVVGEKILLATIIYFQVKKLGLNLVR
ncbi:PREDICTED: uncharacterized protein LOC104793542 isoform X3 [Camelina sativa]|uniref:Uncharacterized protein LOC104793542 isoform X3 n=1 Tax=Camelina sativa TaxID=90675 RepID=A0ABM0ZNE7_CAMSA|nr:PREDICTED: uncharacterized protein LOC104793542 isoform X3 [Camelina sativa]